MHSARSSWVAWWIGVLVVGGSSARGQDPSPPRDVLRAAILSGEIERAVRVEACAHVRGEARVGVDLFEGERDPETRAITFTYTYASTNASAPVVLRSQDTYSVQGVLEGSVIELYSEGVRRVYEVTPDGEQAALHQVQHSAEAEVDEDLQIGWSARHVPESVALRVLPRLVDQGAPADWSLRVVDPTDPGSAQAATLSWARGRGEVAYEVRFELSRWGVVVWVNPVGEVVQVNDLRGDPEFLPMDEDEARATIRATIQATGAPTGTPTGD